jgi:TolA-binding protein
MFVAIIGGGIVGIVAVVGRHDDHSDHSDHHNYSDSNVRDKIALMEQEISDLNKKMERMQRSYGEELKNDVVSLTDNLMSNKALARELIGSENLNDTTLEDKLDIISAATKKALVKEQKRLDEIDKTIARINQIELGSDNLN